jgi:hypothetical protein
MNKGDILSNKPLEQDMIDLAREGLALRLKRAQARKWQLEMAKQRLAELEALNERAVEKLGDPYADRHAKAEMLQRHRSELHELGLRRAR